MPGAALLRGVQDTSCERDEKHHSETDSHGPYVHGTSTRLHCASLRGRLRPHSPQAAADPGYSRAVSLALTPAPLRRGILPPAPLGVLVVMVAVVVGILTAYGQGLLPSALGSLANSSGAWALVAFGLALLPVGPRGAAAAGTAALLAMLVGYVMVQQVRGYASSAALPVFWTIVALIVGPALGLGAHWLKSGRGNRAAVGVAGICGALIGEGVSGLRYIADTTYPPYWWASILTGTVLLGWAVSRRLRRPVPAGLAVLVTVAVSAAFVVVYSRGSLGLL